VNEAAPIARFEFGAGPLRGGELVLYRTSLVHRGGVELETLQLSAIAALRVGFARDTRRFGWGIALVIGALLVLAIAAPLGAWSAQAVADLGASGGQGVGRVLIGFFRAVEAIAALLPVFALAAALGDPAREVARAAARVLAELGTRHPVVTEALRDALRADEPRGRIQAAFTLARLAPPEPRSLPALVAALESDEGDVRWTATRILVEMGRGHGEVLPVLVNLARGGSPRSRVALRLLRYWRRPSAIKAFAASRMRCVER